MISLGLLAVLLALLLLPSPRRPVPRPAFVRAFLPSDNSAPRARQGSPAAELARLAESACDVEDLAARVARHPDRERLRDALVTVGIATLIWERRA